MTSAEHDHRDESREPRLRFLCNDGPLLALNKPAGLPTQAPSDFPSLERQVKQYLKESLQKPGNVYLGVPHRLDRPVSGIVLFARNSKAAARLAEQFRDRTVQKTYLAITEGVPAPDRGTLVDWLLKDPERAHANVVPAGTEHAKQAILDYVVIAVRDAHALVQITLRTGRMHQIRAQFGSRGWPIAGDLQYGSQAEWQLSSDEPTSVIGLHAWRLTLKHPIRYDTLLLEAPLPEHWSRYGFLLPKEI